jgi:hypothetical protein
MSKHIQESRLLAYIRRELDLAELRMVEQHLGACTQCYEKYVSLRAFEYERKERPTEDFLSAVIDRLKGASNYRPVRSLTIRNTKGRLRIFDDAEQTVMESVGDTGNALIDLDLESIKWRLQIELAGNGRFVVSIEPAESAEVNGITIYYGESVADTRMRRTAAIFRTTMNSASYVLSFRRRGAEFTRLLLTFRDDTM